MSKNLLFLVSIFSFFLIPSCHYIEKKPCCGKTEASSNHKKSCCGQTFSTGKANVTGVDQTNIQGEVFFNQTGRYTVEVNANFKGLKPNKAFGFHVHEFGNCENKALMAGGHFNPWNKKHGDPESDEKHLGDMGNLQSDANGSVSYSAILEGKAKKFFGRAIVVHALPDDMNSQPTGNSGDRIACGIIVSSMPPVKNQSENQGEKAEDIKHASSLIDRRSENENNEKKDKKNDNNSEGQTSYASSLIGQGGVQKTSLEETVVKKDKYNKVKVEKEAPADKKKAALKKKVKKETPKVEKKADLKVKKETPKAEKKADLKVKKETPKAEKKADLKAKKETPKESKVKPNPEKEKSKDAETKSKSN